MKLLPYPKYKPSVGVEVRGLKYVSVSARLLFGANVSLENRGLRRKPKMGPVQPF